MPSNHPAFTAKFDATTARPDLRQYRAIHQAIRTSNERFVAALVDLRRSARHPASPALQRWFAGYAEELRSHHRIEDTIFFPALAARVPSYVDYADAVDADHHRLDEVVDQITTALDRLASTTKPWDEVHSAAVTCAVQLRDLMAAHLDMEDREILPMFERHFSAEEYTAMDVQARGSISLRHAMFFVPWFAHSVGPEVAAGFIGEAPPPLKVVHRLTRRRYQRRIEEAFGSYAAHLVVTPR